MVHATAILKLLQSLIYVGDCTFNSICSVCCRCQTIIPLCPNVFSCSWYYQNFGWLILYWRFSLLRPEQMFVFWRFCFCITIILSRSTIRAKYWNNHCSSVAFTITEDCFIACSYKLCWLYAHSELLQSGVLYSIL